MCEISAITFLIIKTVSPQKNPLPKTMPIIKVKFACPKAFFF